MLTKTIIICTLICLIGVLMLFSSDNKWERIAYYAMIIVSIVLGTLQCYRIIKLRDIGQEIHLRHLFITDGYSHYPNDEVFYARKMADGTYSVYNIKKNVVLDRIHYLGIHRIGVNAKDTFDLIKYVSPSGDTLLYDAYLGKSIREEQFEPHYQKDMFNWEPYCY